MENPDLSGAYALGSLEDCRRLYADWAETYDATFAQTMEYRLPAEVAAAYLRGDPPDGDVLDVGAGTGLLAAALRGLGYTGCIDGVDISAAMLAQAATKGHYRSLTEANITRPLPDGTRYAGLVSSGTFTHGHVGPEALRPLLQSAQADALVVLSVNQAVWESLGFANALNALGPQIRDLTLTEVPIYGDKAKDQDPAHAADRAFLVQFRVT